MYPTGPSIQIFTWCVSILGMCCACKLMAHSLGGKVVLTQADSAQEYGKTETNYDPCCHLFTILPSCCILTKPNILAHILKMYVSADNAKGPSPFGFDPFASGLG